MEVVGYVVQSQNGDFLAEGLYWYGHKKPEEAWVHPKDILGKLVKFYHQWKNKPSRVYPATYNSSKNKTTITGKSFDFYSHCMVDGRTE